MRRIVIFFLLQVALCRTGQAQLILQIEDYAKLPITGSFTGTGNDASLARVNFIRSEPGPKKRLFVSDLNGPLYIFDRDAKSFVTYLNLNGRSAQPGLFDKFTFAAGFANGFVSFQFDPDYAKNGKFYTIHIEDPSVEGSLTPKNKGCPGLNISDYQPTAPITTPGTIAREGVVIEWTDSDTTNTIFEGTARELLRIPLNTQIHPVGDLIFNPAARPGDGDWRVLYVGVGDGGSGERQDDIARMNPQRLDTVVGK